MDIGDLLSNPAFLVALAAVMRAALAWQSELTWPEYRTLHGVKRLTFPTLQRVKPLGFDSFVNDKGGRDDAEYIRTVDRSVRETAKRLRRAGGTLHLIASIKRRPKQHGDPLTAAHVAFMHDDGTQTEAYLFRNDDGTTELYSHHEPDPSSPAEHLGGDKQTDGDPRDVLATVFLNG